MVQGFETSRYLGNDNELDDEIAQIISAVIYIVFLHDGTVQARYRCNYGDY